MTNQHPITVPLNLIENWRLEPEFCDGKKKIVMVTVSRERMQYIADQAARWAADQELEACINWLDCNSKWAIVDLDELRDGRRPKQSSLKKQALDALYAIATGADDTREFHQDIDTIRHALEALSDD